MTFSRLENTSVTVRVCITNDGIEIKFSTADINKTT